MESTDCIPTLSQRHIYTSIHMYVVTKMQAEELRWQSSDFTVGS